MSFSSHISSYFAYAEEKWEDRNYITASVFALFSPAVVPALYLFFGDLFKQLSGDCDSYREFRKFRKMGPVPKEYVNQVRKELSNF